MSQSVAQGKIPVLLLKTKSTPHDGYEEYFQVADNARYEPTFVPVLEHRFTEETLQDIRAQIENSAFDNKSDGDQAKAKYGGLIFTSQRAVEAFTKIVQDIRSASDPIDELLPAETPLYVVGPATARGLRALNLQCPILGEETGNGGALAAFILDHYNGLHGRKTGSTAPKPPLLFLVGEQRRDIIPNTLQSKDLDSSEATAVHELVVYETGEMQSFRSNFASILSDNSRKDTQWVVVFSPTGCRAMLDSLELLDSTTGRIKSMPSNGASDTRTTFIATIGPTTRDYLIREFGFEPDVCAEKPSPEGIGVAIQAFMKEKLLERI